MSPWEQVGESVLRLVLALVLGGVIGWQRERADKPAGFRTNILVCVGAALYTLVSAVGFFGTGADPARVASNVVVGIGFLGAGTIWRTGVTVQGLTTAATLWTVAAIGVSAGVGYYVGAIFTTVVVVAVLTFFKVFEVRIPKTGQGQVTLVMADQPGQLGKIGTALGTFGVNIEGVELTQSGPDRVLLAMSIRVPPRVSRHELLVALGEIEGVDEVRWDDAAAAA